MHERHAGEAAELYALGLLDESERLALDAHARECESCARRIGEAEETILELERGTKPVVPPAARERSLRFERANFGARAWAAIAAAFALGFLPTVAGWFRGAPASPHDLATVAMIRSHFSHAQFAGAGPPAKVIYARDRSWLYVIVDAGRSYDVYAVRAGIARFVGSTHPNEITSETFVERPGPLDALQLRDGSTIVETAKVR